MNFKLLSMSAIATTAAVAAFAHSATGVVKDRMDGMMTMGKAVKDIAPMMRGQGTYDPERVRAFAEEVKSHAGEAMTKPFPEGTTGKPSEARPNIWTRWEEFEALTEELWVNAKGPALAAETELAGLAAPFAGGGIMGGASMMGTISMMGAEEPALGLEELAEMPADAVFTTLSQTCSACHTKFRADTK